MPERIAEVFALDKNEQKGKCRFNRLCSFDYSSEQLSKSELVKISDDAVPVKDCESLARALDEPTHVTKVELGLEYTPAAFGDAFKWGLSVQRPSMTSLESIELFGATRAKEKGKTFKGLVTGDVARLRAAVSPVNAKRLIAIFATPLANSPAHADIYAAQASPEDKEAIKECFWTVFDLDSVVQNFNVTAAGET